MTSRRISLLSTACRAALCALTLAAALQLTRCSGDHVASGTNTGNARVGVLSGVVHNSDGSLADSALVLVAPDSFPTGSDTLRIVRVYTDSTGTYRLEDSLGLDSGVYVIWVEGGGRGKAFRSGLVVDTACDTCVLSDDTLRAVGSLSWRVELPYGGDPRTVFVRINGRNGLLQPDSLGHVSMEGFAEGSYRLRLNTTLDGYGQLDTQVSVASGMHGQLDGPLVLPYRGMPPIDSVASMFDTARLSVSVRWGRPAGGLVRGYAVYRGAPGASTIRVHTAAYDDTVWLDIHPEGAGDTAVVYAVAAVDSTGREGPVRAGGVTLLPGAAPIRPVVSFDSMRLAVTLTWNGKPGAAVLGYSLFFKRSVDPVWREQNMGLDTTGTSYVSGACGDTIEYKVAGRSVDSTYRWASAVVSVPLACGWFARDSVAGGALVFGLRRDASGGTMVSLKGSAILLDTSLQVVRTFVPLVDTADPWMLRSTIAERDSAGRYWLFGSTGRAGVFDSAGALINLAVANTPGVQYLDAGILSPRGPVISVYRYLDNTTLTSRGSGTVDSLTWTPLWPAVYGQSSCAWERGYSFLHDTIMTACEFRSADLAVVGEWVCSLRDSLMGPPDSLQWVSRGSDGYTAVMGRGWLAVFAPDGSLWRRTPSAAASVLAMNRDRVLVCEKKAVKRMGDRQ
jgi:hypothetical protein